MGFRWTRAGRSYLSAGLGLIPLGVARVAEIGRQRISRPDRVLGVHLAQRTAMGAINAGHRRSKFTARGKHFSGNRACLASPKDEANVPENASGKPTRTARG